MNTPSVAGLEVSAGAVQADIGFLQPTVDRAYSYNYETDGHEPAATATFAAHRVVIRNVRAAPKPLSLDEHGAALIEHQSGVHDFYDDEQITGVYYPETAAVIKAVLGADRVVVFDHNIRRGQSLALKTGRYRQGRPVLHAHTDFTETSAVRRLREHLGIDALDLGRHRVVQLNVWRPIRAPLRDFPLAICDAGSIGPHELTVVDLIYPGRRGEVHYLTYDPAQRWYYAPDMQVNEAWLIKNYDSATDGTARFAAHSAFDESSRGVPADPRESIEVRAFALFDL